MNRKIEFLIKNKKKEVTGNRPDTDTDNRNGCKNFLQRLLQLKYIQGGRVKFILVSTNMEDSKNPFLKNEKTIISKNFTKQ